MALDTIFHIRYTIVINTIVQQLNFLHQLNIDVKENYEYDNDSIYTNDGIHIEY